MELLFLRVAIEAIEIAGDVELRFESPGLNVGVAIGGNAGLSEDGTSSLVIFLCGDGSIFFRPI